MITLKTEITKYLTTCKDQSTREHFIDIKERLAKVLSPKETPLLLSNKNATQEVLNLKKLLLNNKEKRINCWDNRDLFQLNQ